MVEVFTIIGFFALVVILVYVTFVLGFIILHGGEEFSPLPFMKNFWWVLPAVGIVGWLWLTLFTNSPFSIDISM